jgi:acetyltransferase-like isoleucine patch superfamily enzyme
VNVIVNTGAIVEHDCVLGDHSHVGPGARLGSAVTVSEGAHIGMGASVRQCVRIGRNSVVGVGAAVVSDVPDDTIVVGVPAHPLRKVKA